MHRFTFSLVILFLITTYSVSQEVTARMLLESKVKECQEIQYATMQLIPLYYLDGDYDTAVLLLNHWEKQCGTDETIYRTRLLWAIETGKFSDTLITDRTISYLDTYQRFASDTTGESIYDYYYYAEEFDLLRWYKSFTDSLVANARNFTDLTFEESFFLDYYHSPNDSVFSRLLNEPGKGSKIDNLYSRPVTGSWETNQFHVAGSGGMWTPSGNLDVLGIHPSIGGVIGLRRNKMLYNLALNLRIGATSREYDVVYDDSIYSTNEFFGINLGLEAGRQLYSWRRHEAYMLGGLDLETINVLTLENDPELTDDNEYKYITSPSIHVGIAYRFYMKNERYGGINCRYHFINFSNPGGTSLSGNALSVTVEYGFGRNQWLSGRRTYLSERLPR